MPKKKSSAKMNSFGGKPEDLSETDLPTWGNVGQYFSKLKQSGVSDEDVKLQTKQKLVSIWQRVNPGIVLHHPCSVHTKVRRLFQNYKSYNRNHKATRIMLERKKDMLFDISAKEMSAFDDLDQKGDCSDESRHEAISTFHTQKTKPKVSVQKTRCGRPAETVTIIPQIVDHIDADLAGISSTEGLQEDATAFLAGFLRELFLTNGFSSLALTVRNKVKFMAFLLHMALKVGSFDPVHMYYTFVEKQVNSGEITWAMSDYLTNFQATILEALNCNETTLEENLKNEDLSTADYLDIKGFEKNFESFSDNSDKEEEDISDADFELSSEEYDSEEIEYDQYVPCKLCPTLIRGSFMDIERHMFAEHGEGRLCSTCGYVSEQFKDYVLHSKQHSEKCSECPALYVGVHGKKFHMTRVHGRRGGKKQTSPTFFCKYCPKSFVTSEGLNLHFNKKHDPNRTPYSCHLCSFSTFDKPYLKTHVFLRHNDESVRSCDRCGKKVKNLRRHIAQRLCTGSQLEKTVKCPNCSKKFRTRKEVKNHQINVHKDKKHQCEECDYRTSSAFNLRLHVGAMHGGERVKKEKCLYCDVETYSMELHIQRMHPSKIIEFRANVLDLNTAV